MQILDAILLWMPIVYIFLINLISFLAMWWDKRKASKQEWRVAEATLHIIGCIGGAVGIFVGMYRFRHKTQKRSFQALAVIGLIVSLIIYWFILQVYV
ncbi:MAG: DUF1294 domain-containing protein [Candidatus Thorarchaeota archaeon]